MNDFSANSGPNSSSGQIKDKIKVLHCITSLYPDGAQQMLTKLLSGIDQQSFENRVVSLMADGQNLLGKQLEQAGVRVDSLDMKRGLFDPRALWHLRRRMRSIAAEYQPDIIQGWMYHGNLAAVLAGGKSTESSVIWNIRNTVYDIRHESLSSRLLIRLSGPLSRKAERIIYCAANAAPQHESLGFAASKRVVIGNGFDTEKFRPSPQAYKMLRKKLELPEQAKVVGIIGRYHPQKDHQTFLKAAADVARVLPNVHFVMIGRELDSSNTELKTALQELGLQGRVHLLGQCGDIQSYTAAMDVFCLSSLREGFPNVVGEAMSCGVPCVVTDVGAAGEIVEELGHLVQPKDPAGLAQGIIKLLELNDTEHSALSRRCRTRIIQRYSIASVVNQYQALYRETVSDSRQVIGDYDVGLTASR